MEKALNCLGCQLARGEVIPPGGVIWFDHFWHLAHDANNFIPGFLILSTISHLSHIYEIPEEDYVSAWMLIHKVRRIMADQISLKDFILFQSDYATSRHFHLWMMPIYPEKKQLGRPPDGIMPFLQWSKGHWNIPEKQKEINQISEILRHAITKSLS